MEIPTRRLIAARDDSRPLYLNTPGYRVGCNDEVLRVKEKDKVIDEVRIREVSHVALFGNIQISTQAIQALCELEVPIAGAAFCARQDPQSPDAAHAQPS